MKKKNHSGLVLSLAILLFLAVFSEKKILITKGYAVSPEEVEAGAEIYRHNCSRCHDGGKNGSPSLFNPAHWKTRIEKGAESLALNALEGFEGRSGFMPPKGGNPHLSPDEVSAAVAYMILQIEKGQ